MFFKLIAISTTIHKNFYKKHSNYGCFQIEFTKIPVLILLDMAKNNSQTDVSLFLLDYEEIIKAVPELKTRLSEEEAFEFSQQLYEFTKLIYEESKNEKERYIT